MLDNLTSTAGLSSSLSTDLEKNQLLGSAGLASPLDLTSTLGRSSSGRNVVIFVADGLRYGSINPIDAPTLYSIREEGVDFGNSHALFPTFTTPNASAIATGHYLGDTGDFGNTIYAGYPVPPAGGSPTPFIENDPILGNLNQQYPGTFDASDPDTFSYYNFLNEETLLQIARGAGYNTAAVGKLGPTLIQDVSQGTPGADGKVPVPQTVVIDDSTFSAAGVPVSDAILSALKNAGLQTTAALSSLRNQPSGNNTTPGTLNANVQQQQYFTDAITKAILPTFKQDGDPFALVYWSRDPDGTQHNQGDSLNSLTPGINGPTSRSAVKNADNNLAQIIQSLKDQGLYDNTDIFITADHGFSTISKSVVDAQGTKVNDYASTLSFAGVNPGFLPAGFVAIDVAHGLGENLFDPDQATKNADGTYSYKLLDPTQGQRPNNGNGLIASSATLSTADGKTAPPADVVIAANGGSDLVYIPNHDAATLQKVVDILSKQNYVSGLFVDDSFGSIAGTLPLSSINLEGTAQTPKPSIVINFKTFSTDLSNPYQTQVEIADSTLQQGQGMHGTFGRGDTFNNMAAIGPDFKRNYNDLSPVSNADVAVTLLHLLGLPVSDNGDLMGRVINEALVNGPDTTPYTTGLLKSAPDANGNTTYLNYQQVGNTKYFDTAGYANGTVGLTTALKDGLGGQRTFVINKGDTVSITNFGGVGTGVNPSRQTINRLDTLKFVGQGLDARNLLLSEQGNDLVLSFEGDSTTQVILKNFNLENLDNLNRETGASVDLGNILFNGQSTIQDSFDVFNADWNFNQIFNRNSVTFLNDLNNTVRGFDNSNDVINGEGGNDLLEGRGGDDFLRGGDGNDTLVGGAGNDTLEGGLGADRFVLSTDDGTDTILDFTPREGDIIALPVGLTFNQISITQGTGANANDALVSVASSGKQLAIVKNFRASNLTQNNFTVQASPKVIVISLDGATPRLVNQYLASGVLPQNQGLGLLQNVGISAQQNVTITPSLTAPGHIAIATGSSAANNDVISNTFHLVASPFSSNISGFNAPIGGYGIDGPAESTDPTAIPVWIPLRQNGKSVIAATFPGADGLNVTVPGLTNSPIIQPASERTVDYTVPFGAFAGVGGQGFTLTAADFSPAPGTIVSQLTAAGKTVFSPVLQKTTALETFTTGGVTYNIQVAALDTTNDNKVDYDTLVFFDANRGIQSGPFSLPSTGPAYVQNNGKSSLFYLEGSSNRAGTAFFVSQLAPDLSTVHIARYSANSIPRNSAVLSDIDDINNNVGFWIPQADFRFPERLNSGLSNFSDAELEAIYEDQVSSFVDYQTRVALRALSQKPDADLALIYIEQPDGSEHQFLITDPRQATDPTNPNSIGAGQDQAKITRYQTYLQTAYKVANNAVQRIIQAVGTDGNGVPNSDIIVVSDHGFDPFFTAVNINNLFRNSGIPALADTTKVRAVTSGPAVNVYINLQGREPNGTVTPAEYVTLQQQIANVLKGYVDSNPNYTLGASSVPLFDKIYTRPVNLSDTNFGLETSDFIGQDSGDVFALLTTGYNFDGIQTPVVTRLGDPISSTPVLSVPNFYGAHGYDPTLPDMSAIFFAAGPDFGNGVLNQVRNIDITPTIDELLGVQPADTVQGKPIDTLR